VCMPPIGGICLVFAKARQVLGSALITHLFRSEVIRESPRSGSCIERSDYWICSSAVIEVVLDPLVVTAFEVDPQVCATVNESACRLPVAA